MEGRGISRGRAVVVVTTVSFLLSATAAYAQPGFELTESSARAGDVVHVSISGPGDGFTYEFEVGDEQVLEGSGSGLVSDKFTMPDLGDDRWNVTVEAEIGRPDKHGKKVKRKLWYLGGAAAVPNPPAPVTAVQPPAAPTAPPVTHPAPGPVSVPTFESDSHPVPGTPPSSAWPRPGHGHLRIEPQRHPAHGGNRSARAHHKRNHRGHELVTRATRHPKRHARGRVREAPGFNRYYQHWNLEPPKARGSSAASKAIAPAKALLTATRPGRGTGGDVTALLVPALLGLAGLTLAGIAAIRARRQGSRPAGH